MALNPVSTVVDLLVHVFILLPKFLLSFGQPGIKVVVGSVNLEVKISLNLCMLVGGVLQRIAVVMTLVHTFVENLVVVIHEPTDVIRLMVNFLIQGLDAATDLTQRFIHLPPSAVNFQA